MILSPSNTALGNISLTWDAPIYLSDEIVTGTDSDMTGANNWITALGTPAFDVNSTVANNLYINFSSGNEAIKLENTLTIGEDNYCEVRLKKISGTNTLIEFGNFSGSETEDIYKINHQTSEYVIHKFTIRDAVSTTLFFGSISADNNGGEFAIDYIKVWTINSEVETNEFNLYAGMPTDFNLPQFLNTVDETKKLYKIGVLGNSIMANPYGGTSFDDEGAGKRPPIMTYDNIPRRVYDYIKGNQNKWNLPNYRRIDHADWTLGTPANWTEITGSGVTGLSYDNTAYKYTQTANEYAEIIIPDGFENAALIFHADDVEFGQNYDDVIAVTLNGGSIAAYGDATINTSRVKDHVDDFGNQYFHSQYLGLPSGANTIRITKSATTKTMMVWGVMYWTGNTVWFMNLSLSGYSMRNLYESRVQSVLVENEIDTLFFEITGMNEASNDEPLNTSQKFFEYINNLSRQFSENILLYGTHPFGDNGAGTNYYTLYSVPNTLKEIYNREKHVAYRQSYIYLDVFKRFESRIIADGGTLEGGEGGLTYTTDGQHPNELCAGLFSDDINDNAIRDKLE